MEKITLAQIGLYNPQRLTDSQVEALFIVRKKQFRLLMDCLAEEKEGSIPQHHLIIAQRGMGKTTLLKRLEVELRKDAYRDKFVPLLFPEEQYNVKNIAEFWLNCIDVLADTMDIEKNTSLSGKIDEKIQELTTTRDVEVLSKEAYDYLMDVSVELGRRPVLLIDNMTILFDRLKSKEQHLLRSLLMKNGAPVIIGGSVAYIEETTDYGAPFYDAFRMHYLKKLEVEEIIEILTNLAGKIDEKSIIPQIDKNKARIKALHLLTGGNPRTAVMLFRLILKGFSKDIGDDLDALLDEATPIYKARFEELPEQMQVIVDSIALNWDPITLEKLREVTRYENGQLSPQLKRLLDMGWIEKPKGRQGKGGAYEMSERFFNIWFLMRRSSRRHKKGVYCLSRFLEAFYGDEINEVGNSYLSASYSGLDHIINGLALSKAVKDKDLQSKLSKKAQDLFLTMAKVQPDVFEQLELSDVFSKSEMFYQALVSIVDDNYKVADRLLTEFEQDLTDTDILKNLSYLLRCINFEQMQDQKQADRYFEKLIKPVEPEANLVAAYCITRIVYNILLNNENIASKNFRRFVEIIKPNSFENVPNLLQLAGIAIKHKHTKWLISILEEYGYDAIWAPYYVAVRAFEEKNPPAYLNTKALEIRETAMEQIKGINKFVDEKLIIEP